MDVLDTSEAMKMSTRQLRHWILNRRASLDYDSYSKLDDLERDRNIDGSVEAVRKMRTDSLPSDAGTGLVRTGDPFGERESTQYASQGTSSKPHGQAIKDGMSSGKGNSGQDLVDTLLLSMERLAKGFQEEVNAHARLSKGLAVVSDSEVEEGPIVDPIANTRAQLTQFKLQKRLRRRKFLEKQEQHAWLEHGRLHKKRIFKILKPLGDQMDLSTSRKSKRKQGNPEWIPDSFSQWLHVELKDMMMGSENAEADKAEKIDWCKDCEVWVPPLPPKEEKEEEAEEELDDEEEEKDSEFEYSYESETEYEETEDDSVEEMENDLKPLKSVHTRRGTRMQGSLAPGETLSTLGQLMKRGSEDKPAEDLRLKSLTPLDKVNYFRFLAQRRRSSLRDGVIPSKLRQGDNRLPLIFRRNQPEIPADNARRPSWLREIYYDDPTIMVKSKNDPCQVWTVLSKEDQDSEKKARREFRAKLRGAYLSIKVEEMEKAQLEANRSTSTIFCEYDGEDMGEFGDGENGEKSFSSGTVSPSPSFSFQLSPVDSQDLGSVESDEDDDAESIDDKELFPQELLDTSSEEENDVEVTSGL